MPISLLVSAQNVGEVTMLVEAGVDWIDLKDPHSGSLGLPAQETMREVADALAAFGNRSVAIGELKDLQDSEITFAATRFPIVKAGLSGALGMQDWIVRFQNTQKHCLRFGCRLVAVAYADHPLCSAPTVEQVFQLATDAGCEHMLVDTFAKKGQTLFDWMHVEDIDRLYRQCQAAGIHLVLAGSLKLEHWTILRRWTGITVAVRGAVCAGDRKGGLSRDKLRQWQSAMRASILPSRTEAS